MACPRAGNVVGSAVINRGADYGQAQGYVDAVFKMQQFERNQSLVMIHAYNRVIVSPDRGIKNSIRRMRAAHIKPPGAQPFNGRGDNGLLLAPEERAFAGMRVQGGNCNARLCVRREVALQAGAGDLRRFL